jgi:hypothetical protein
MNDQEDRNGLLAHRRVMRDLTMVVSDRKENKHEKNTTNDWDGLRSDH